jgi:hypothetical protein
MQCGFNPGELVATRVEKASECPEIRVKYHNWEMTRICGQISRTHVLDESDLHRSLLRGGSSMRFRSLLKYWLSIWILTPPGAVSDGSSSSMLWPTSGSKDFARQPCGCSPLLLGSWMDPRWWTQERGALRIVPPRSTVLHAALTQFCAKSSFGPLDDMGHDNYRSPKGMNSGGEYHTFSRICIS